MTATVVDFDAIKTKQQATWSSGDYAVIGTTLQITGESLCEAVDVGARERVLDVAAGNGNAALAAARRDASVTATDYVRGLLDRARVRAATEGVQLEVREGDAEALPFAGSIFDVVLSTFGVMFAPNQERAAAELLRVCRPGGRIGVASWTPDSFVGEVFRIVARHIPPIAGVPSPLEWGSDVRLRELFGSRVQSLTMRRREFVFRYRSPERWLEVFRRNYGPTHKAFDALDRAGQAALARDLLGIAYRDNTARNGAFRVASAYLEVVAVKAA